MQEIVHDVALQSIASSPAFYREIACGRFAQISSDTLDQGLQLSIGEIF
jgi:hypothetical protein